MWQYGLQIVKHIFPLICIPYLTRVLEPDGYALYAYVIAFMGFAAVFVDYGFNLSGTKKIVNAPNTDYENTVFTTITIARIILSLLGGIAVAMISQFVDILRDNLLYVCISYAAVCVKMLSPDFLFQGKERMGPLTTRFFVAKGISTALTFVFVHSYADILWVPILDLASSFIAFGWSFVSARHLFGSKLVRIPLKAGLVIGELKDSGLYCLNNMASAVFTAFATLIIGVTVTDSAFISYWALATTVINSIAQLYTPIGNSLYPHMLNTRDFGFARKMLVLALPVLIMGAIALVVFSRPIIWLIGGPEYLEGTWILICISPVVVFNFYSMIFGWPILGAMGKTAQITASTIIVASLYIGGLLGALAFGLFSLPVVCVARCLAEVVLFGIRFGVYLVATRKWAS